MGNNGSKVKGLFTEIKTHWNKPAKGKYVPYKEYVDILFGVGANYAGNKTLEYISFAAGCYLMMYHYKLPYLTYAIISLINTPLNYVWTLIGWVINDNLGFLPKKTERNFYGLYFFLIAAGLAMISTGLRALLPHPLSKFSAPTFYGTAGQVPVIFFTEKSLYRSSADTSTAFTVMLCRKS